MLSCKYHAYLNDAAVTDILRQANIKTKNHLMDFSDSSCQDCPYTGKSTGAYIIIYQGGPIDHGTHVPRPFAQSSAESEYNSACTTGIALAHFRIFIHELLNKDPDIVPEEDTMIVLDSMSSIFVAVNVKDTKHTRQIVRIMHLVSNGSASSGTPRRSTLK